MGTLVMVDGAVFGAIKDDYHDRLASNADSLIVFADNCMGHLRWVRSAIRLQRETSYHGKTFRRIAYEALSFPDYAEVSVNHKYLTPYNAPDVEINVVGNVIDCAEECALDLFLHEDFISAEELGVNIEDKPPVSNVTISRMA